MTIDEFQKLLILVRHGESEGNIDHSVYARKKNFDIGLTEKGKEQSRLAGQHIRDFVNTVEIRNSDVKTNLWISTNYYCSPYVRAKETLQEIHKVVHPGGNHDAYREELLCSEQAWGEAEGTAGYDAYMDSLRSETYIENQQGITNQETYEREKRLRKILDHIRYRPTRGENLMDVYMRAGLFMEKFNWFSNDQIAIVSAHKGFLTMLHYYLIGGMPSTSEFPMLGLAGSTEAEQSHERAGWKNGKVRVYCLTPNAQYRARFIGQLPDLDS
jgi:broad specificity phosphatase PhoE